MRADERTDEGVPRGPRGPKNPTINAGKVVVGGGSDKKTNFMEPTVVSGVKLDDSLMKVLEDKPYRHTYRHTDTQTCMIQTDQKDRHTNRHTDGQMKKVRK